MSATATLLMTPAPTVLTAEVPLRVRSQSVIVLKIPTNTKQVIEVVVTYCKDGRRGYRYSVTPVEYKDGMMSFGLFSGKRVFIEDAKRFSEKRLIEIATDYKNLSMLKEVIAEVAGSNKLVVLGEWGEGLEQATEAARLANLAEGMAIQARQVEHCAGWIRKTHPQNEAAFRAAVEAANVKANPQNLYDVPRGGSIEVLAFTVGMEKTEADFQEWHRVVTS